MSAGRDRRVLGLGLTACLTILSLARGLPLIRAAYAEERSNAADLVQRLAGARRAIASRPELAARLQVERKRFDSLTTQVFSGTSHHSAAAAAASYVSRLARGARVELAAVQFALDSGAVDRSRHVILRMTGRSDIRGLTRWLAAVEAGDKRFRVASLAVRQPDLVGREGQPEVLDIQVTLRTVVLESDR